MYLAYAQLTTSDDIPHDEKAEHGDGGIEKFCEPKYGWLSCMAFAFTAFVSFTLNERITQIGSRGCYRLTKNCPPYLNKCTLRFGLITNIVVVIVCWISALFTIFMTSNTKDMIYCAVALYFIINLDKMMMATSDYQTLNQWFEMQYGMHGEWWRNHCRARGMTVLIQVVCVLLVHLCTCTGNSDLSAMQKIDKCCKCSITCERMDKCNRDKLQWCKWFPRAFTLIIPFVVLRCFNDEFDHIYWLDCTDFCFNYLKEL